MPKMKQTGEHHVIGAGATGAQEREKKLCGYTETLSQDITYIRNRSSK